MLHYPAINPVAFHLGKWPVHWYGIMYLIGFVGAWALANLRARKNALPWDAQKISDLIFAAALGVVLGGRLGYVLFYNFNYYFHHPLAIFAIWDGGMSFHGGLIGVAISLFIFSRRQRWPFFAVTDFITPFVPIGLGAGRIGNFINGELWGRVTRMPWGMIYPNAGPLPRHPSEIYEFLLEGVLLFIILWCYSAKPRPRIAVSALFLLLYGCFRFFAEFFRQPDPQLGFVAWGWVTMGQVLSLPMIVLGVILLTIAYERKKGEGIDR